MTKRIDADKCLDQLDQLTSHFSSKNVILHICQAPNLRRLD